MEADEHHTAVAAADIARAGLDHIVDLRVGRVLDALPRPADEVPFGLVFIDADKPFNPAYLEGRSS
ncbi:hypothetical protein ACFY1U_18955 [Streptomyces sp. NPDC001351]|uniref:hypothetical protein n=1 Tax=Streptomyces sp. NPDC001351 TaxID=3364564 RepID=UPI0036742468